MEIPPNPEYPPQIPFGLRCPFCGHEGVPFTKKQLSTGGWVLFAVLVLFCIPICWLPFVIDGCQEIVRHCARCGSRLG